MLFRSVYDKEEDYEEYDLTSCRGVDLNDYGTRRNIHGNPIGIWDPTVYANLSKDPIRAEIYEYQKYLARGLNPWWTTRKQIPLSITSDVGTYRTKNDVTHKGWSPWLNTYAISPVPPSNVPGSDYSELYLLLYGKRISLMVGNMYLKLKEIILQGFILIMS